MSGAVRSGLPEPLAAPLARAGVPVDPDDWVLDVDECAALAHDVHRAGASPLAAYRPPSAATLARVVAALHGSGIALVARGGGMSYTDAFLCEDPGSLLIDTRRLAGGVAIAEGDAYVRVQAGVTWAELDRRLAERGLRTPFRGPLSGAFATVGGALSQGSTFLGSGQHGAAADSVLGLEVVTGTGTVLRTGAASGTGCGPFFRHAGPDLTGLFLGDCGALGIKTEASLKLLPAPTAFAGLSFQFREPEAQLAAMSTVARLGIASECFGFDPVLMRIRLARAGLAEDLGRLSAVWHRQGTWAALKVVLAGRGFLDPRCHSLHLVVEGRDDRIVRRQAAYLRQLLRGFGEEIEASIPRILRASPYAGPTALLSPDGERFLPVHGIVAHSRAPALRTELAAVLEAHADLLERGVRVGFLSTVVGAQGLLLEPVIYWRDAPHRLHRQLLPPDLLATLPAPPGNPELRAGVLALRRALTDCLERHGAVHFQIGRHYRWRSGRDPGLLGVYDAVKRAVDPLGVLNPGVLR